MKLIYVLLCILLSFANLLADIPPGYYDGTEGLTGNDLKLALYNIIKDHIEYPYTSINTDVWDILKVTDADPNSPDSVILIYTGWKANGELEYYNGQGWSREHVWAKSHGDFGTTMGAGTDVHHLRPCDISVNSARGNKDFDNGGDEYVDPDGATGCYTSIYTWEPRDAVKGDVARMIFYMAVRYEGEGDEPDLEMVDYVPSSPNKEPFHGKFSTLLEWHSFDPVDDWEQNRNDIIYEDYQNNRNPFIDHPEFVGLIWNPVSINSNVISKDSIELSNYPNPFNPTTTISYSLKENAKVLLNIYNIKGQKVKTLVNELLPTGEHSAIWNGRDANNKRVGSGIYFYKFEAGDKTFIKKMILMR